MPDETQLAPMPIAEVAPLESELDRVNREMREHLDAQKKPAATAADPASEYNARIAGYEAQILKVREAAKDGNPRRQAIESLRGWIRHFTKLRDALQTT